MQRRREKGVRTHIATKRDGGGDDGTGTGTQRPPGEDGHTGARRMVVDDDDAGRGALMRGYAVRTWW